MAVEIPKLQRVAPVAPGPQGRIRTQAIDVARPFAKISGAVEGLGREVIKYMADEEDNAIDTHTNVLANQLDAFANTKLYGNSKTGELGLSKLQGDPTDAYNNFDRELAEKRDNLIGSADLSDRGKKRVSSALFNRYNSIYNKRLTMYGSQLARHDEVTTNASVKLRQRDASDSLAYYDTKDPGTIAPFKQSLSDIQGLRFRAAIKNGTAQETTKDAEGEKWRYMDPDGEERYYKLNPSVKEQITGDMSEAIYNSINAAVKSGQVDKANQLMKDFKDQIAPDKRAKLAEALEDKLVEEKSFAKLAEVDDLPLDKRRSKLRAMKTNTARQAKVKLETLKLLDANVRYRENEQKRASTDVYNQIANQMQVLTDANRAGANLVDNSVALENAMVEVNGVTGPAKNFIGDITDTKQRQALFKLVETRSKAGDDDAFISLMNDSIPGGEMYGMDFATFHSRAAGLSKTQYTTAKGMWVRLNTESDPEMRSRYGGGFSKVMRHAETLGLIKKSRRTRTWNKRSKEIISNLSRDYEEASREITKGTSQIEIEKMARKLVIEEKQRVDQDSGGFLSIFFGPSAPAPSEAVLTPKGGFDRLTQDEITKVLGKYQKANPDKPDFTMDDVKKFYEETNGAR